MTLPDAIVRVQALALRVLAERLELGEAVPGFLTGASRVLHAPLDIRCRNT